MDRTTPVIGIQERIQEQDYGEPTNLDHPDAIAHVPDALWEEELHLVLKTNVHDDGTLVADSSLSDKVMAVCSEFCVGDEKSLVRRDLDQLFNRFAAHCHVFKRQQTFKVGIYEVGIIPYAIRYHKSFLRVCWDVNLEGYKLNPWV